MPEPIRTRKTTGIYGAPRGLEAEVGGLPFYRQPSGIGNVLEVVSVWAFSPGEREQIARGGNLVLGILGEPIPPVSLRVDEGEWFEAIPDETPTAPKEA